MASWDKPRSLGEGAPEGAGRPVGTRDGAPKPTLSGDAPAPSPSDRTARCPGCKTHRKPGFLCSECGTLVPFPVDKYPGQTDHIPF